MAKGGRPPKIDPDVLHLIKKLGSEGKTSPEIVEELSKLNLSIPERSIRYYIAEDDLAMKVKEAAADLLKKGALQTTLQHEIEETAARKKFLLTEAAKIWEAIPKSEKNSIKVFLKLIELAQKDSEMLIRVLGLPEPTVNNTESLTKSLEQKLGFGKIA